MGNKELLRTTINLKGTKVNVITYDFENDYINLTDIANHRNEEQPDDVVNNWLRLSNTVEYLGYWETINNPSFNLRNYEMLRRGTIENSFTLSPNKWIKETNAIGIIRKQGKIAGTYAHKDLAFKFASWISPEFELYVIKDYQAVKNNEDSNYSKEWFYNRTASSLNLRLQTDAIKSKMPEGLSRETQFYIYATEADIINKIVFGKTASEWRSENKDKRGNARDYAMAIELLLLQNLELANSMMIREGIPMSERINRLQVQYKSQLDSFVENKKLKKLKKLK